MNPTPRIVLAGGSGFLGHSLSTVLISKGFEVVVLGRTAPHNAGPIQHVEWDGQTLGVWRKSLEGARAVINFTGKNVNCRHTTENRRQIVASRVNSVRALGEAVAECTQPPQVFIQIAGTAIFGDTGDRWCDENAPQGDGFLADVSRQWEGAFEEVEAPGMRKNLFRLGPVLGPTGGLLEPLARLTRWFLGGHVGNGRQFFSWIHIVDLQQMFLDSIELDGICGVFNAVAPNPVTNADFMRELRRALHRPWSPPVPEFAAKIGAWVIGTDATLALTGQRCTPRHLLEKEFSFQFPNLRQALANIYPN